ncbi:MAG: lytic transglycosylase domain-containing protein [Proteobacteria bacterium]|nr:lytic transglycosylase domain-containing protein [Pseudomonadota bacterium]
MSSVIMEALCDIGRFNPARTVQMIERHLQDGQTDLSSEQIPSVAKIIYEEARFYGIDYRLVLAIMAVESNFRNDAVSRAGARGIMQIRPILASSIAKEAGIPYRGAPDLFEPVNNVRFGLYYLSWLSSNFKNTKEVLLAYNIGHNRAKRLLSRAGDADNRYTRRVMGEYQRNMTNLPAI